MRLQLLFAAVTVLGLSVCGGEEPVRRAPALATLVFAERPDLTIGVVEGDAENVLSGVTDATRLSDGSIVVADCQSAEVRWFDAGGRFVRAVGGRGEGPGEFTFLRRLFPLDGDSLGAYDGIQARAVILGPQGEVANIVRVGRLTLSADLLGRLSGIFYGGQDEGGVVEFDTTLAPVGSTTTLTRPEPMTDEAKQAFQAMLDAGADVPLGGIGSSRAAEYAPEMPAFGDLVAGRDGRLWIQDPVRPGRYPLIWTAYRDGTPVARLEVPPRFFPFEFGPDWALGVSFDELAVERVELWTLTPGELPNRVLPPRDAQPPTFARCGAWASR